MKHRRMKVNLLTLVTLLLTLGLGPRTARPVQALAPITLTGRVLDTQLNNGPLPGARFVILKSGVTWSTYKGTFAYFRGCIGEIGRMVIIPSQVLEVAYTNSNGYFSTRTPLSPGATYAIALDYGGVTGFIQQYVTIVRGASGS